MLKDIIDAKPLDGHRLWLRFEDGIEGIVDLTSCLQFTGVFAALTNREQFNAVQVDRDLGTVRWPCGADLDPDVLYSLVAGVEIPSFDSPTHR
jgi:hypothetical protein